MTPQIEVLVLSADSEDAALRRAGAVLRTGALLIYPTDTLYALGGLALEPAAGEKVRVAKGRPEAKPLPLVAASLEQARTLTESWPVAADTLARAFWPGPLTIVLRAAANVPVVVTGGTGTVAVRVPARALVARLCADVGPLVSTSANRTGEPAAVTCGEAVQNVGESATLALDGGPGSAVASTIVDLSGGPPRLLRAGAVEWTRVLAALGQRP